MFYFLLFLVLAGAALCIPPETCSIQGLPEGRPLAVTIISPTSYVFLNVTLFCNSSTLTGTSAYTTGQTRDMPFKVEQSFSGLNTGSVTVTLRLGAYVEANGTTLSLGVAFVDSAQNVYNGVVALSANVDGEKYPRSKWVFPPCPQGLTPFQEQTPTLPVDPVEGGAWSVEAANPDPMGRTVARAALAWLSYQEGGPAGVWVTLDYFPAATDPQWPAWLSTSAGALGGLQINIAGPVAVGTTVKFGVRQQDDFHIYGNSYFNVVSISPDQRGPCALKGPAVQSVEVLDPSALYPAELAVTCPPGTYITKSDMPVPAQWELDVREVGVVRYWSFVSGSWALRADAKANFGHTVSASWEDSLGTVLAANFTLFSKIDQSQYRRAVFTPSPASATVKFGNTEPYPVVKTTTASDSGVITISASVAAPGRSPDEPVALKFALLSTFTQIDKKDYITKLKPRTPEDMPSGVVWVDGYAKDSTSQTVAITPSAFQGMAAPDFTVCFQVDEPWFYYSTECTAVVIDEANPTTSSSPAASSSPAPQPEPSGSKPSGSHSAGPAPPADNKHGGKSKKGVVAAAVIVTLLVVAGAAGGLFYYKSKAQKEQVFVDDAALAFQYAQM